MVHSNIRRWFGGLAVTLVAVGITACGTSPQQRLATTIAENPDGVLKGLEPPQGLPWNWDTPGAQVCLEVHGGFVDRGVTGGTFQIQSFEIDYIDKNFQIAQVSTILTGKCYTEVYEIGGFVPGNDLMVTSTQVTFELDYVDGGNFLRNPRVTEVIHPAQ